MIVKPFKLLHIGKLYDDKTNKYINNHTYGVEDHRHNRLDPHNNTNKGLGIIESKEFWKKLLGHPITAFGYIIEFENEIKNLPNPKFDRHDVIKALDFWIEYWVYQNKCDYILEGTVNKDFELTVRELIETREKVMKYPADTKFTRKETSIQKFTEEKLNSKKLTTMKSMIEYTESVNGFCHVEKTQTYKEYMKEINNGMKDFVKTADDMAGIFAGIVTRGDWTTDVDINPTNWIATIATGFRTAEDAQRWINEHSLPSEVNTVPEVNIPERTDLDMLFWGGGRRRRIRR